MKKLLTIALSLVMIFSMTAVSFADDTGNGGASKATIVKKYTATNAGTTSPAETFTFTIIRTSVTDAAVGIDNTNMPLPTIDSVTYAAGDAGKVITNTDQTTGNEVTVNVFEKDVEITLPEYSSVGVYTYTINEVAGDTAGVGYYSKGIKLVVTVIEDNGKVRVATVHTEDPIQSETANKKNDITNTYSAGSLAVTKEVTGNMGDQSKVFNVKVTFTAPEGKTVRSDIKMGDNVVVEAGKDGWTGFKEVSTTITHDQTITFTNIPYGVTYTVEELEANQNGYTTTYTYSDNDNKKIDSLSDTVTIENNKQKGIDTGIFFDNGIYIAILAIVLIAAAAFIIRRRQHRYDA